MMSGNIDTGQIPLGIIECCFLSPKIYNLSLDFVSRISVIQILELCDLQGEIVCMFA